MGARATLGRTRFFCQWSCRRLVWVAPSCFVGSDLPYNLQSARSQEAKLGRYPIIQWIVKRLVDLNRRAGIISFAPQPIVLSVPG